MNFENPINDNRKLLSRPFLVAHRGVSGANIPCNTLAAFRVALSQGADVVELDVSRSSDDVLYVFHPGMEHRFIGCKATLSEMTSEEIEQIKLLNADGVPVHYKIPRLSEAFALLKDRAYINVDKFWAAPEEITREIYDAGVQNQVIVKTYNDEKQIADVEKYAPELMYMIMSSDSAGLIEKLKKRKVNFIGVEALYHSDHSENATADYVKELHDEGLLVWHDAIIYDESEVISAGHSDDVSVVEDAERGWGALLKKGVDFIQTDWLLSCKAYLESKEGKV